MNIEISRRAFLAAGPLAVMSSLGLAGCGKSSISGKTLYYYSVCGSVALGKVCANKPGSASTIKFEESTWHYVGSQELSGDWEAEGDDVVLSSSQLGTVTLVRQDDGSYVPSGCEDYGERYFEDESAAKSYYDEYTAAAPDRVKAMLEGTAWSVKDLPSTQTVAETLSFDDGSLAFTKGEYQRKGSYTDAPRESSWLASDHSGEYKLDVTSQWVSSDGSSPRPLIYEGTMTVGARRRTISFPIARAPSSLLFPPSGARWCSLMENRRDRGRRVATTALARMASRKAAAVAAAFLLLAFLVLVWTNVSPAENGAGSEPAAHAWRESEEASGKDGGTGSGTQSDASEASEPAAEGGQSEEASSSREEATGKAAGSSNNSGNKGDSSSKKDGKSDSKPNGGNSNSSSSGSNSGGSSKKDDTPAHIHKYDIYHPAVTHTETVHHPAVTHTESRSICNGCGADITGNERNHAESAMLAGNAACGAWHSEQRTVTDSAAWDETVTVTDSPAYYTCSCGATK